MDSCTWMLSACWFAITSHTNCDLDHTLICAPNNGKLTFELLLLHLMQVFRWGALQTRPLAFPVYRGSRLPICCVVAALPGSSMDIALEPATARLCAFTHRGQGKKPRQAPSLHTSTFAQPFKSMLTDTALP